MFYVFFLLFYNFLLKFGSLKTIRNVLPIDLPGEPVFILATFGYHIEG